MTSILADMAPESTVATSPFIRACRQLIATADEKQSSIHTTMARVYAAKLADQMVANVEKGSLSLAVQQQASCRSRLPDESPFKSALADALDIVSALRAFFSSDVIRAWEECAQLNGMVMPENSLPWTQGTCRKRKPQRNETVEPSRKRARTGQTRAPMDTSDIEEEVDNIRDATVAKMEEVAKAAIVATEKAAAEFYTTQFNRILSSLSQPKPTLHG